MNKGGAERVVCNLSNYLSKHHHEVLVVATEIKNTEYAFNKDVKLLTLPVKASYGNILKRTFIRLKALHSIFISERPNIICAFLQEPIARLLLLKLMSRKVRKIPTIISVRINPEIAFKGLRKITLPLYGLSEGFVFQTKEIQQFFNKKIQKRSTIISNPIDPSFFDNTKVKRENLIISVGRLTTQKNYPMLLNAFKTISSDYPNLKLEIYGDGELKKDIEKLKNNLGLQDKVFLMGKSNDIKSKMQKAKLFVLTSDYEGMSNALMEAMALGIPSIATNSVGGGSATLIQNYKNGILIPINDSKSLVKEIRHILSNKSLYANISKKSKQSMSNYKPEKISKDWEQYLETIANKGSKS